MVQKEPPKVLKLEEGPPPEIKDVRDWLSMALTAGAIGAVIVWVFHLSPFGLYFTTTQAYLTLILAFILPQVFILMPAKKGAPRPQTWPWYDILLAALGFFVFVYLTFETKEITYGAWEISAPLHAQILALIAILLVLEGTRRTVGWFITILCAFFAIYPLFAPLMPPPFTGIRFPFWHTMTFHAFGENSILGVPVSMVATLLLGFFVFATFLIATGAGNFFFNSALGLLGHVRGGPAKVAVMASSLFGSISGSVTANILTTGSVTIPTMKSTGYPARYAGAIEACASTGGVIMPPIMGLVAFVMVEFVGMSYGQIIIAAIIPALLYYLCLFLQADAYAARNGLEGLPREMLPSVKQALAERGWYVIIAGIVLLYFILVRAMESQAPLISCIPLLILPMFRKHTRLGVKNFISFLQSLAQIMAIVMPVVAAIGLIVGSLVLTGAGHAMARVLVGMTGGNMFLLLLVGAVVAIIMGMGMTSVAVYIILAIILTPAFTELGLNRLAAHLFVVYYAMVSFITPPVCVGAYQAAALARSDFLRTGLLASRLGIAMYLIPFLFILQPGLILQDLSFMGIVVPLFAAIVGIAFISWGAEGYMLKIGVIPSWARVTFLVGGGLIAWPGVITRIIGLILVGLTLAYILVRRKVQTGESVEESIALSNGGGEGKGK